MRRLLFLPLAALALLALPLAAAQARAEARLAPGEALAETHLRGLIEPVLPLGETFELAFTRPVLPLRNPARVAAFLELLEWRHDERAERFAGSFLVRLETGEERVLGLAGRATAMVEVWVPRRSIAAGERLDAALLEPLRVASRQLRPDTLLDPAELDGLEAGRRLLPGRPVRRGDVRSERLVRRGETVDVVYRVPGIELVTVARALEDGGHGGMVAVSILDTGQRLAGLVTGPGEVSVAAGRREVP